MDDEMILAKGGTQDDIKEYAEQNGADLYETPIWDWFELSYAQYLAIPRSILQTMPIEWQKKFVELMDELDELIDWRRDGCWVKYRDSKGRFIKDELCDYKKDFTPEEIAEIVKEHNGY